MKLLVTKKEYDAVKDLVNKVSKELDIDVSEINETIFADVEIEHEAIKFSASEEGITMDIDEYLVKDVLDICYSPVFVKIAKWIKNTMETFSALFEKVFTPACDFIVGKWNLDEAEITTSYDSEDPEEWVTRVVNSVKNESDTTENE